MKLKNILIKELFNRKYRNRIKRSKKGKGSFKRLKKIKVEDWKKEREKKKVKEKRKKGWDVAIQMFKAWRGLSVLISVILLGVSITLYYR